jgi:hypothetical protein
MYKEKGKQCTVDREGEFIEAAVEDKSSRREHQKNRI